MFFKKSLKHFTDKNKLNEAKRRAMEMYEKMQNQEKQSMNKQLEKTLLEKTQSERQKYIKKEGIDMPEVEELKSKGTKQKIEEIVSNFNYISSTQNDSKNKEILINRLQGTYRVDKDILYFRLSEYYKSQTDQDNFVKIYQLMVDDNFEKFKNLILTVLKLFFLIYSVKVAKKYIYDKTQITLVKGVGICIFYISILTLYFTSRSFNKSIVKEILLKGAELKINFYQNNKQLSANVEDLFSITSKRKNVHEILMRNRESSRIEQLFLYKNAVYDANLLKNICHPNVKSVRFTNMV
jgi:hypothetical protein